MIQYSYRLLCSVILLSCTFAQSDLTKDLESQPKQVPQMQATLTFEAKNINQNPQLKEAFIEFAANNLATQDQAMIDSIIHLAKKYPEASRQLATAIDSGRVINPTIAKAIAEQEKENNKTALQKIVTFKNLFKYGVMPILNKNWNTWPTMFLRNTDGYILFGVDQHNNITPDHTPEEHGGVVFLRHRDNVNLNFGRANVSKTDNGQELSVFVSLKDALSDYFIPKEQWARAITAAIVSAKITQMIKQHAQTEWGWNVEPCENKEENNAVERYSSLAANGLMWGGIESSISGFVVNPLLNLVLP